MPVNGRKATDGCLLLLRLALARLASIFSNQGWVETGVSELRRVARTEEAFRRTQKLLEDQGADGGWDVKKDRPVRVDMPDEHQVLSDRLIHHVEPEVMALSRQDCHDH